MEEKHIKTLIEFAETAICRFCNDTDQVQTPPDGEPEQCQLCSLKEIALESLKAELN